LYVYFCLPAANKIRVIPGDIDEPAVYREDREAVTQGPNIS